MNNTHDPYPKLCITKPVLENYISIRVGYKVEFTKSEYADALLDVYDAIMKVLEAHTKQRGLK